MLGFGGFPGMGMGVFPGMGFGGFPGMGFGLGTPWVPGWGFRLFPKRRRF
ncbi:MAG TPA: hypothetical protein VFF14_01960 [Candidatus Deferrimicrobium sp.]|nr:hypothetical protein [Candidatus Deferrimicrobium sp.]